MRDRFAGCLVGQAWGDACGFPVEGRPPQWCELYLEHAVGRVGRGPFPFGQYTDDTQLARELLISWVERGTFDPADFGRRVGALFATDLVVGRGQATEQAAVRLAGGVPWDRAGTAAPSAGNGSAMRAAPVGLMCADDPDRLVRVACDQSRVTHTDPRCLAGSVAIAAAVALGDEREPLVAIADLVEPVEVELAASIRWLGPLVELPPSEALGPISVRGKPAGHDDGWRGISPFVVPSVLWALYAWRRAERAGEQDLVDRAVRIAIAGGGDVDTTAAMAGAIAGARAGLEGVPTAARVVNDRGAWGYDELVALAGRARALTG